ncbi:hypothetical protein GGI11_004450, partial [Coemansia sp. RSA 2049]
RRWDSAAPEEKPGLTIRLFGQGDAAAEAEALEEIGLPQQMQQQQQQDRDREQQVHGLPEAQHVNATIVLNSTTLCRVLVESLLLPAASSGIGSLLGRIPAFRRSGLGHFGRAMLGGCAYFVFKDIVRVLYKYLLYRTYSSRYIQGRKRF